MSETVITVRGEYDTFSPAQRATLSLTAGFQGPDKSQVFERTSQATRTVREHLATIADPVNGPVTWWSMDQVRSWAERPWNQDGKQLPLVHHTAVNASAKFRDFDALARFVQLASTWAGVTISGPEWTVTESRKAELVGEARRCAVEDAVARAQQYAIALGLTTVVAVAVADVGMLGDRSHFGGPAGATVFARSAHAKSGGEDSAIDLTPGDVKISAAVDARFVAS